MRNQASCLGYSLSWYISNIWFLCYNNSLIFLLPPWLLSWSALQVPLFLSPVRCGTFLSSVPSPLPYTRSLGELIRPRVTRNGFDDHSSLPDFPLYPSLSLTLQTNASNFVSIQSSPHLPQPRVLVFIFSVTALLPSSFAPASSPLPQPPSLQLCPGQEPLTRLLTHALFSSSRHHHLLVS